MDHSQSVSEMPASRPITVLGRHVYRGPHLYGKVPMVHIKLDLGPLEGKTTHAFPGYVARLLGLLPSLQQHPGGLVQELQQGMGFTELMQVIAMELQCLAGSQVEAATARPPLPGSTASHVFYPYQEERLGLLSGWFALRIIHHLLPEEMQGVQGSSRLIPRDVSPRTEFDDPLDVEGDIRVLNRVFRRYGLGPTTRSLVEEARNRGIPWMRLDDQSLVQLGYGRHQQRIRAGVTSRTSSLAAENASDKDLTKQLLEKSSVPVPRGEVVYTLEEALEAADSLGYPLVSKPLNGNHGRGITLNLKDPESVARGFELAQQHGAGVILEQQFTGRDHRVLVVNGRLVAVAERVPAHVVGDGNQTIEQLIHQVNLDPRRGEGHEKTLTRIRIDEGLLHLLQQEGLSLASIPARGQTVYLRDTANLSTGGTAIDRTDEIHPENRLICERAARAVGLDIAGMDLVCPDITRPVTETGGGIIEVNAGPGFRMHLHPSEGKPRNVAKHVMDMLFPPGRSHQLPIVAITGTNGKSTTTRMTGHILRLAGYCVGLTTSNGIYIGGHLIDRGDTTGPRSARTVLMDPEVDMAVLETARGGLLREGLAFESCTVGALLNVAEDHLGVGEVHTIEDLARVKSTVIESVRKDGFRVLNADDSLVARFRDTGEGTVIWFSRQGLANPLVAAHVQAGGTAVVHGPLLEPTPGTASQSQAQQPGWVLLYQGGERIPLVSVTDIPATLHGLAEFNIENSLAAAAIGVACGVSPETVATGLRSFHPSFEENPGRMNFFYEHPFTVLMDYAHNPAGLTHIGKLVKGLREKHRRVIGVLSGTGDRRDEDLLQLGQVAGGIFDELIVKDDERRGREVGEGPRLVAKGAQQAGLGKKHIQTIQPESAAVAAALEMARTGDLVVVLASDVEKVWQQIRTFQPDRKLLQME